MIWKKAVSAIDTYSFLVAFLLPPAFLLFFCLLFSESTAVFTAQFGCFALTPVDFFLIFTVATAVVALTSCAS